MRIVTSLLVLLGLALAAAGIAAPRESALRWKLEIAPDTSTIRNPAGRMSLTPKRGGRRQVYWYLVYTVKNLHDESVPVSTHMRMTTDASDEVFHEGYYPAAIQRIRQRWGDDVKHMLSLKDYELGPGETVRAVAIFQLFKPDTTPPRPFEEGADKLTIHVSGIVDPVKRTGLTFEVEERELKMHFLKRGDQYDPHLESVEYVGSEEVVVSGPDA